jgi:hypothetical protein
VRAKQFAVGAVISGHKKTVQRWTVVEKVVADSGRLRLDLGFDGFLLSF